LGQNDQKRNGLRQKDFGQNDYSKAKRIVAKEFLGRMIESEIRNRETINNVFKSIAQNHFAIFMFLFPSKIE
jgi:hypothetical protein